MNNQYEVRYTGDFGRSLFGVYPSFETAKIAAAIFIKRLLANESTRAVAKTVDVI